MLKYIFAAKATFLSYFVMALWWLPLLMHIKVLGIRPPAVPLVVTDPYFSVWSTTDNLADSWPSHWNGHPTAMQAMIRVDNVTSRLMGLGSTGSGGTPAFPQVGAAIVTPTRTVYTFASQGLAVNLSFLTPIIASDPTTVKPLTIFEWSVAVVAGQPAPHSVSFYFDVDAELCTNNNSERVLWGRSSFAAGVAFDAMRIGTKKQKLLDHSGNSNRINWGYVYVGLPRESSRGTLKTSASAIASSEVTRGGFIQRGAAGLPATDDTRMPRMVSDEWVVASVAWDLPASALDAGSMPHTGVVLLAYDDIVAISLDGVPTAGAWRDNDTDPGSQAPINKLLSSASGSEDRAALSKRAAAFDTQLMAALTSVGGHRFAAVGALAYRQTMGAHVLVRDAGTGELAHLSRECGSGDDILTMDVIIDSLPFFLYFGTELLKAQLRPLLKLATNKTRYPWPHAYAPHDLGQYPLANAYDGGSQETMPIEETGNAMIMILAITQKEGSVAFADQWWGIITRWADYLVADGLFPASQLSSDDFDGPLANRTNLAAKAVIAIGAYGAMCHMKPDCDATTAAKYNATARSYAYMWQQLATASDGHLKLCYHCSDDTWGMQYSLWFDQLLGLGLFPPLLYAQLKGFYAEKMQPWGLPLDQRHNYTIQPWQTWMYSLPGYGLSEFEAAFEPTAKWVDATPDRFPLSDWYRIDSPRRVAFEARSMWGGIYGRLFTDTPELQSDFII
eukprot:TRINITY_DN28270_c0_g1_i1.p1 TRINITY_DN28270_c0_g1~~TRINITY_DN28270_c0_g1_i1.p1  ORF type:complete len:731 (-),score=83.72 TRINITY_DN28270_c0_g1_i1:195-2387(-)